MSDKRRMHQSYTVLFRMLVIIALSILVLSAYMVHVKADDLPEVSTSVISIDGKEYLNIDDKNCIYLESVDQAADYLREAIKNKEEMVRLSIGTEEKTQAAALWEAIEKQAFSGDEREADYLELSLSGETVRSVDTAAVVNRGGQTMNIYYYECVPDYYKDAPKEEINAIIKSLSIQGKDDYYKTKKIYQYICDHVDYDWDFNESAFSSYGACVEKKAVCQGFSMLFYQMGKKAGLDVGIVYGTQDDGESWVDHAWNVVNLNGSYYYLDTTLDSDESPYQYFLKGTAYYGSDHKADHNLFQVSSSNYKIPEEDRKVFDSSYKTPVSGIKLYGNGISNKIAAGKTIQLKASIKPDSAADKRMRWSSSNTKAATVNLSGRVTVNKKAAGKTVWITASASDGSGKKASWKILVMKGSVKKIRIKGKKTVKAGKTLKLKAKVKASKGANKKLQWISGNEKYAKVSQSGKVKTYKAGKGKKVTITALATDGSGKKKTVKIRIK